MSFSNPVTGSGLTPSVLSSAALPRVSETSVASLVRNVVILETARSGFPLIASLSALVSSIVTTSLELNDILVEPVRRYEVVATKALVSIIPVGNSGDWSPSSKVRRSLPVSSSKSKDTTLGPVVSEMNMSG